MTRLRLRFPLRLCLFFSLALLSLLLFGFTLSATAESPWTVLEEARQDLASAGPTVADFLQVFAAAGFDGDERETGELYLELPRCLRFEYLDPYPKGFLLCGTTVHHWVADEPEGQRFEVDPRNEPGLDLLLLSTEDLRLRYRAESRDAGGGLVEVSLAPVQEGANIVEARLTVQTASRRVVSLEYTDIEGNHSRFEISGYRPLAGEGRFEPPQGITWSEG